MGKLSFKTYFEATDIFGFSKNEPSEDEKELPSGPIEGFDIELMMNLLSRKKIGQQTPTMPFISEIRWGQMPGAIKLEVDTGYTFYIKKLAVDKVGSPRWVTKRMFQLNRRGYGGLEDKVAQEVFEHLENYYESNIEAPVEDYKELDVLVKDIYDKVKKTSKAIFLPEGIHKLHDDAYIIKFGVRGHGLEAPGNTRVEQNQTMISYDREAGTIRICNYNLESPVGGAHEFAPGVLDLDLYFMPTQERDEISETIALHMKYY